MRFFVALMVASGPALAQDLPAIYRVTGVAAGDVLNVRAAPDAGAERLGALARDARAVEVTALAAGGDWGRVNLDEGAGWVAMRFLVPEGGPVWHSLATPLACFGTEPFWRLTLARDGATVLDRMDGGAEALRHGPASPPFGEPLRVGFTVATTAGSGFAEIAAETCSDGMSDRLMGLSFHLFLESGGELRGCCSLAP